MRSEDGGPGEKENREYKYEERWGVRRATDVALAARDKIKMEGLQSSIQS